MQSYHWAILLKPFGALIMFGLIALPISLVIKRLMPDGKVKTFLFRRIGGNR